MPFTACHTHHQPHPPPPPKHNSPDSRRGRDKQCTQTQHNTTRPTPNRAPDASRDNATKKPAHPAQSTRRTNKQTQQNKRQPPTPHPRHKTPRAGHEELSRCSRPLSRSQTTTPHHPTSNPTGHRQAWPGTKEPHPTPEPCARAHTRALRSSTHPSLRSSTHPNLDSGGRLILQNPNSVSVNDHPRYHGAGTDHSAPTTHSSQGCLGLFPHLLTAPTATTRTTRPSGRTAVPPGLAPDSGDDRSVCSLERR
jgi:hypothetical protein